VFHGHEAGEWRWDQGWRVLKGGRVYKPDTGGLPYGVIDLEYDARRSNEFVIPTEKTPRGARAIFFQEPFRRDRRVNHNPSHDRAPF